MRQAHARLACPNGKQTGLWLQGMPGAIGKVLRRRYFLVEKARNASIVGILVGTLGVAGYLDVVDRVRELAKRCAPCPGRTCRLSPSYACQHVLSARQGCPRELDCFEIDQYLAMHLSWLQTNGIALRAGKKTYTVLMGKPAPAKLANFPEVEVWVQVRKCLPVAHTVGF